MWETKRAPLSIIALVIVAQIFFDALFNFYIFKQAWIRQDVFHAVYSATHGLIAPTLIANAIIISLCAIGMIVLMAGLRGRDLGLSWSKVRSSAMFAAALWIIVNLAIIVISLAGGSALSLDPAWHKPLANIGTFLAQIFGNALYEEIVYRGFLTVQAILLLQRFGKMPAVIGGVLIAQLFFATLHLPTLIAAGVSWDQALAFVPQAFAMGCMLAAIYLLTGNLLLAVAAHALTDSYMLIFSTPLAKASYAEFVYGMLALALVLGSWTVNKRKQKEPMLTSVPSSRA